MIFRHLILVFCLLLSVNLHAQTKLTDTIRVHVPIALCPFTFDSLAIEEDLEADFRRAGNDAYYKDNWNTTQIHYAKAMLPSKDDTVTLSLVGRYDSPFCPPVRGKVISRYGRRSGRMHTGTDIKLNSGDTVRCAFDGRVRLARRYSGYGNLVLVRHRNGLETIYSHLKAICVQVDDELKAGDLIGLGGRTGRATTDHLHFETRFMGEPFDSGKYIDFDTFALSSDKIYYKNRQVETDLSRFKGKTGAPVLLAVGGDASSHVISRGDNLWTIARRYRTTVSRLCAVNNIPKDKVLKIGTVLKIN